MHDPTSLSRIVYEVTVGLGSAGVIAATIKSRTYRAWFPWLVCSMQAGSRQ